MTGGAHLNRPDSGAIVGASLMRAEVSFFEDRDMQCNNTGPLPRCYYSFVWNIRALHMEAITPRA